ncbi:MAG: formylglycine-generating enzyme family protein, partial [Deltaproteobacteria bacterium]|nr:formylglycine-generating enzyme family protein [Deltaproteobacteria bacterium]
QVAPDHQNLKKKIDKVQEMIRAAKAKSVIKELDDEFVLVKGGCFPMGCGSWASDCSDNEKPAHETCVSDITMGRYEVTQSLWEAVLENNPSRNKKGDKYPVERVSWEDTQIFIKKLNEITGKKFRLPTEAEWEYACRSGGKAEKYCGGENLDMLGWYGGDGVGNSGGASHPVGQKRANGLGIYDMSGNVAEWCSDNYDSAYYKASPRQNPTGTLTSTERVIRGGSWYYSHRLARSTSRSGIKLENHSHDEFFGLRLVRQ